MTGALEGLRIIEMAGIGPAPFCGMMLADHGAEVITVQRAAGKGAGIKGSAGEAVLNRSRKTIAVDLKHSDGTAIVRKLAASADGLIEGFRPGVMERLGLGPDVLLGDNPRLVFGRMTGWGQTGPYAATAGHDINYIALSGALHTFGRVGEKPTPPVNTVGDFGGGGMLLAFGMLAGILAAQRTGQGQVIDCAMTDGSALLSAMTWALYGAGKWRDERGVNLLDTGAHFYDTYATADGKYISIGAIEPQFYQLLRDKAGLADDPAFDHQHDAATWPARKARLTTLFASRTRDHWCELLEGTDACFAPVLSMSEAPSHPHNAERATFIELDGITQPAPGPRFSGTPAALPTPARQRTEDITTLLSNQGFSAAQIAQWGDAGIVA